MGMVYSLVSIGINLISGVEKIVNFAHGDFMMIAMYIAYFLWLLFGLSPYASTPLILAVMFVMGFSIQKFALNRVMRSTRSQMFITIGLSLIMVNSVVFFLKADPKLVRNAWLEATVVPWLFIERSRMIAFVVTLITCSVFYLFMNKTMLGKAMRATAQNREAISICGVDIRYIYSLTFGLGVTLSGMAGILISPFFAAEPRVGGLFLGKAFVVMVIGGLGNFGGAFVGGLIIGLGDALGAYYLPGTYKDLIGFSILVLVLLFRPKGLFGGGR
jgi:branched-chain amino acid transport system permease protein